MDTGSSNMAIAGEFTAGFVNKLILAFGLISNYVTMRQILGPYCRDEMERKCAIDTFYYPEKSNTSEDQHIPVGLGQFSIRTETSDDDGRARGIVWILL